MWHFHESGLNVPEREMRFIDCSYIHKHSLTYLIELAQQAVRPNQPPVWTCSGWMKEKSNSATINLLIEIKSGFMVKMRHVLWDHSYMNCYNRYSDLDEELELFGCWIGLGRPVAIAPHDFLVTGIWVNRTQLYNHVAYFWVVYNPSTIRYMYIWRNYFFQWKDNPQPHRIVLHVAHLPNLSQCASVASCLAHVCLLARYRTVSQISWAYEQDR